MIKICIIEPGPTGGPGSMGAKLLCRALESYGCSVTHARLTSEKKPIQAELFSGGEFEARDISAHDFDAVFISTIYTRQWTYLSETFRRIGLALWRHERSDTDPLVAFGGQTSFAPSPILPFADVVALGDGEATGIAIADAIGVSPGKRDVLAALDGKRGFWVPSGINGGGIFSRLEVESVSPVIVYPGDADDSRPTIEVARGCKSKCAFCPIGWAGGTYRESSAESVKDATRSAIARGHSAVNLFAPDYSSVTYVDDLDRFTASLGCKNNGADARIDKAERHLSNGGIVKQFSFGIEGPSERLRRAIGKPLKHTQIVDTMARLKGVGRCKWYVILGLPGETDDDIEELKSMTCEVAATHGNRLDITLTHLQAVPHTPLQDTDMRFNEAAHARGLAFREWARDMWNRNGWMILVSGIKGRDLHEHDAFLQRGDESVAAYIAQAKGSLSYISSGRWRKSCSAVGIDPCQYLKPEPARYWDFVDVGIDKSVPTKAMRGYWDRYHSTVNC